MEHFGIEEAIKYHEYMDTKDEILNRKTVNMNALFYAIMHLMGIKINITFEEDEDYDEESPQIKFGQQYQDK